MPIIENHVDEAIQGKDLAIIKALEMIGFQAEHYASLLCPVDTGNLQQHLTHGLEGDDTVIIGSPTEYAPYVELGTQRTKAQPYLKPAVVDHIDEYKRMVEDCFRGV